MTIEDAITKATEAGYHIHGADGVDTSYSGANDEWSVWTRKDNDASCMIAVPETLLDPLCWRILGRALRKSRGKGVVRMWLPNGRASERHID
jgi:hypothetical protein